MSASVILYKLSSICEKMLVLISADVENAPSLSSSGGGTALTVLLAVVLMA